MLVLLPITAVHANNGYGMTAAVRNVCFRYQPIPHVFELSHLPCYGLQLTPQDGSQNY